MESLVTLISSLSESGLLNNPVLSTAISIIILVGIVSVGISFIIDLIKNIKDSLGFISKIKIKNNHFSREMIDTKIKIEDKVKEICTLYMSLNTDVKRVSIYQFHNGTKAATRMPFHYCVLTNEVCGVGIAHSQQLNRHDDMRIYTTIVKNIITNEYFDSKVEDLPESLIDIFSANGTKYIRANLITDAINPNILIGMIIIESTDQPLKEEPKDHGPNVLRLDDLSKIVSGLLCNVVGRCKYCSKNKKCKYKKDNKDEDCRYFSTTKTSEDEEN